MKERKDGGVLEKERESENETKATKKSEKEMERKVQAAMEELKILDCDLAANVMRGKSWWRIQ